MAYLKAQPLGDISAGNIAAVGTALQAASKIIEDPFLPEVTCQILRLNKISKGVDPGPPCQRTIATPAQLQKGIGLSVASKPLRMFVWGRQHPILATGIGIGALALIFGLGYSAGKRKRSA